MKIASLRTPILVLICATLILFATFGARQTYGLMMDPISSTQGWGREVFSFAVALQSLFWGLSQPVWGGIADRYGAGRVVSISLLIYAAGLYLMSTAVTPLEINFSTGLLTGIGLSGASFPILLAVVARNVSAKRRSLFLGIASGGGSSGQLLVVPVAQYFMSADGYASTLVMLAVMTVAIVPLAAAVSGRMAPDGQANADQSVPAAIREASGHGSYLLLIAGFFVCGFQTMFIGAHLPAYLTDAGASPALGATALAVIGLFNVIGCFLWGGLGGRFSKKYLLAMLYMARSLCMVSFIMLPISEFSVIIFSAIMGVLWLGTVPLTSGLVAQMFGTKYMAMLYGFVFLNHQIGSFIGIWLGGMLFDRTGTYDMIWWIAIALGLVAALVHWPIKEHAVVRLAAQK